MSEEKIILKSYNSLKHIKTRIYKFGNIPVLVPIAIESLAIFSVSLVGVLIIDSILKIPINQVYKFIGIPLGLTMVLKTTKIEGKAPYLYLWRLIQYQLIRKKTIENFEIKEEIKEIRFK